MNPGPMKYDDLDYTPVYGSVEVRGERSLWPCNVSIEQGRAMEADGLTVFWIESVVPEWVATLGLTRPYLALYRIWTWPQRVSDRGRS